MKKTLQFAVTLLLSVAMVSPLYADREAFIARLLADHPNCPIALEDTRNPVFQSSLTFLENPVPVAGSVATTEAEMQTYAEIIPGTELTFRMIPIKGGTFTMGSPDDEEGREDCEGPQIEVTVKPFWMGEHEVTWLEFRQFALLDLQRSRGADTPTERERTADAFAFPTPPWGIPPGMENANRAGYPAAGMTIFAAQMYARWLTAVTGRYYRLPTEAEWEFAARAGTTTAFSFGDDGDAAEDYAWFFDNALGEPAQVGQLKPNPWGLYDMHGNVAEWVLERWNANTYAQRQPGTYARPVSPPVSRLGQLDGINVLRGGSADSEEPADLRSARRIRYDETWRRDDPQFPKSIWWLTNAPHVGFRLVRPLEPPATEEEARIYEPNPENWFDYRRTNSR